MPLGKLGAQKSPRWAHFLETYAEDRGQPSEQETPAGRQRLREGVSVTREVMAGKTAMYGGTGGTQIKDATYRRGCCS